MQREALKTKVETESDSLIPKGAMLIPRTTTMRILQLSLSTIIKMEEAGIIRGVKPTGTKFGKTMNVVEDVLAVKNQRGI